MRNKSAKANHQPHCASTLQRLTLILLLVLTFYSVAAAQLDPIRERGAHTLYGDIKVDQEAGSESHKLLSLEVQLYIINGTLIGRQTVSANGRYRFTELRDGEYDVVVLSENSEVARVRVRVQSVYKTDFRQDIMLEARTNRPPIRAATVSASDVYERSSANKSLFEKAEKAIDAKKYDEALDLLGRLVAADPKDFQAWTELGTVQLIRNNAEEAEKAYRHAIEERPSFALALLNLGRLFSAQKKFEAAIEPLAEAVKSAPTSPDANFLLGEAYLQIKKGSKAVPYLTEAARLGKPEAHLRLAALYNGAGMKDKAAIEYEEFLKKKPDYPDRKKLEQYIMENKPVAKTP
jgi:tetratricopeptide (TPR) repeat protein